MVSNSVPNSCHVQFSTNTYLSIVSYPLGRLNTNQLFTKDLCGPQLATYYVLNCSESCYDEFVILGRFFGRYQLSQKIFVDHSYSYLLVLNCY